MKRTRVVVMAVAIAASVAVYLSAPRARLILRGVGDDGTVAGILHVHTNRSDGGSSPDEVAAAARRAGLTFVVFTDHGDGTRPPDPPVYRSGVLCLDGVEISTTGGHYIAIGMPESPYPLGGEPRDVVEDVRRLGGLGIAAHVDSPKDELRWRDWDAPIDGVEILNPDTGWRARVNEPGLRPKLQLLGALSSYTFVPEETIASLLADPSTAIERWRALAERRPVVAVAGVDAHAKLALWDVEPGDNRFTLPFPGYTAAFRTLSVRVRPDQPLSGGDASADAALLLQAIRGGHLYTVVDAIATPPFFEFSATSKRQTVQQGGMLPAGEPVRLHVRSNAPPGFSTSVWQGDRPLATGRPDQEFTLLVPQGPAVYRAEIRASNRSGEPRWIISNPIYVGLQTDEEGSVSGSIAPTPIAPTTASAGVVVFPGEAAGWTVERDATSRADLNVEDGKLHFNFTLGPDRETRPHAALTAPPLRLAGSERVTLRLRAERPMRLSVQLRSAPTTAREDRWQRSVYVDPTEREVTVSFDDMKPVGADATERPVPAENPSLVLVIDTTNAKAGSSGRLWISRVTVGG